MSRTSSRPALQPNQRRTARKVSRASSSPREHLQVDAGALADRSSTSEPVRRLADRRGDEGQQLVAALLLGLVAGLLDRLEQRLLPRLRQHAVVPDVLGEPQQPAVVVHRRRVRAAVGVDHQQVHGVRSDVQHPEPHGAQSAGSALRAAALRRCLGWPVTRRRHPTEVPLDFAREWVEFTDPADPEHLVRADLTWLTSAWTCIFGRGCAGVVEGRPDDGCCSHGAFFTDDDDLARVTAAVGAADRRGLAARAGRPGVLDRAGRRGRRPRRACGRCAPARSTAPACSSTGPGFPGGAGCALHRMALRTGVHPLTTKPDVCWQLPVRREQEHVERPDGTTGAGDHDRRVRPARLGPGRPRPALVVHRLAGRARLARAAGGDLRAPELTALLGEAAYAELRRLTELRLDQGLVAPHPASPQPGARRAAPAPPRGLSRPARKVCR